MGVAVVMFRIEGVRRDGHNQTSVLDSLEADQTVCELLDASRLSVNDKNFEAGVVVEVGVAGGDNQFVVLVLEFGELFCDAIGVVVVDESDGADDDGIGRRGAFNDQLVADQIAERFRAVGIATVGDRAVEASEKIGIESDADSAKVAHEHSCVLNFAATFERSTIIKIVLPKSRIGQCLLRRYVDSREIANALIEERWRSPEVPYFGRVAGKQDICTAEAAERSRKAPPGRFQGHRENPTLPGQTYTFTCTFSQFLKMTCFICFNLRATATHLKVRSGQSAFRAIFEAVRAWRNRQTHRT
jgi:hypothetical protein